MPAAELHAHGAGVDVDLVVDDDEVIGVDAVCVEQLLHRAAARVHEALRLGQHDVVIAVRALGRQRAALVLPVARAAIAGEYVDCAETRVVPRLGVFLAWVAQARYEPLRHDDS